MLKSLLSSFVRAIGRSLGYTAARRLKWLAIPLLIVVAVLGYMEVTGSGVSLHHIAAPGIPTILHTFGL